jgi:hypothetical protein
MSVRFFADFRLTDTASAGGRRPIRHETAEAVFAEITVKPSLYSLIFTVVVRVLPEQIYECGQEFWKMVKKVVLREFL